MIKLSIVNMEDFLQIVNRCAGAVNVLYPDGRMENINKRYDLQEDLTEKHRRNRKSLRLTLDIPAAKDYFSIVLFSIGDC